MTKELRVQPFCMIFDRHLVDAGDILCRDHPAEFDIALKGNLALGVFGDRLFRPAKQKIRLNTDASEFTHRMLGRLGLELACRSDERHQGEMQISDTFPAKLETKLADRFQKRQPLDVADRTADLAEHDIDIIDVLQDALFDHIGDMRHHLHRAAEIIAMAFFGEHPGIDLAGGYAIRTPRRHTGEALIMAEVEIGLSTIIGNVDFTMLIGAHRPRIDIEIGIEFAQADRIAARLKQRADGCGCEAFAQGRNHAAGDEHKAGHGCETIDQQAPIGNKEYAL